VHIRNIYNILTLFQHDKVQTQTAKKNAYFASATIRVVFSEVFRAVDIIANEYLPVKRLKFFMSKENRSQLVSTVICNSNIDR